MGIDARILVGTNGPNPTDEEIFQFAGEVGALCPSVWHYNVRNGGIPTTVSLESYTEDTEGAR